MAYPIPETSPIYYSCPLCGNNLISNAKFCGKCGHAISEPVQSHTLPNHTSSTLDNKSSWHWILPALLLWVFLLLLNGALGISAHLFDISSPTYDLGAQSVFAIVILIACIKSARFIKPLLTNSGFRGPQSLFEVVAAIGFIFIFMWAYIELSSFIGFQEINYLQNYNIHNWPVWSAFILICLMPGIFEELAFRGYIMTKLEQVGGAREAVIIQAAMFSVLHMLPIMFISHFFLGLVLGIVRLRSNSLYPGMVIHTAWNAIVISKEVLR